jgi:hypothetical protein
MIKTNDKVFEKIGFELFRVQPSILGVLKKRLNKSRASLLRLVGINTSPNQYS